MDDIEPQPRADGDRAEMPEWASPFLRQLTIRGIVVLVVGAITVLVITGLASQLKSFFGIIFTAFFLSFALEPGVNWFAARGWRRGSATGLIFLLVFLAVIGLVALIIPAIVTGARQLITAAPGLVDKLVKWANDLGWHISAQNLTDQIKQNAQDLAGAAKDLAGNVFGIAASILGGLFRWATIALFTFYIVAEGPKLRRIICGALPPRNQQRVLFVWNQAIEKTGGYFYSRLLLAVINGTGMYATLRGFRVPFAAPLAIFEGLVAEFIPIVGTYIAGAPPVLVAVLFSLPAGIAAFAYVLIYQQIENYFLSPRLTAKTMALHPALAFAAALIGGALGGVLTAFLALPVAGVIQAVVVEFGRRYEVVESDLTSETPPERAERGGAIGRMRDRIMGDDRDPHPEP
jgi:predicted PurR-regulated permease PerM